MPEVAENRAAKPAKSTALVYVIVAIGLSAAGAYYWIESANAANDSRKVVAETAMPLETFVVNLDGNGQRAYLRVGITLGLNHPLPRDRKDEPAVAQARDAILTVLSSARPEQLLTSEGKEKLKDELLRMLQERVPALGVEKVYFTEFLVQM